MLVHACSIDTVFQKSKPSPPKDKLQETTAVHPFGSKQACQIFIGITILLQRSLCILVGKTIIILFCRQPCTISFCLQVQFGCVVACTLFAFFLLHSALTFYFHCLGCSYTMRPVEASHFPPKSLSYMSQISDHVLLSIH